MAVMNNWNTGVIHIQPDWFETLRIKDAKVWVSYHVKGGLGLSAGSDKLLCIWESQTGIKRRLLEGHVAEQYSCRFFPSGKVVLAGGADMQIRIWCAQTGQCVRQMAGHTGAIMDVDFVDRGRNVFSVGRDGSALLWDCATGICLESLGCYDTAINSCSANVAPAAMDLGPSLRQEGSGEIGTDDKLLAVGCQNGHLEVQAVGSRRNLFFLEASAPINAITLTPYYKIIAGCENGTVYMVDVRQPQVWEACDDSIASPVLSLLAQGHGVWIARQDGSCTYSMLGPNALMMQLSGPNCDPVNSVCTDGKMIFTACRDGFIRSYELS